MASTVDPNAIVSGNSHSIIQEAAMRRRRESASLWAMVTTILVVLGAVGVLFAIHSLSDRVPVAAWLVMTTAVVLQLAYSNRNSRCPSCDKFLGVLILKAHFCPRCGSRLVSKSGQAV